MIYRYVCRPSRVEVLARGATSQHTEVEAFTSRSTKLCAFFSWLLLFGQRRHKERYAWDLG